MLRCDDDSHSFSAIIWFLSYKTDRLLSRTAHNCSAVVVSKMHVSFQLLDKWRHEWREEMSSLSLGNCGTQDRGKKPLALVKLVRVVCLNLAEEKIIQYITWSIQAIVWGFSNHSLVIQGHQELSVRRRREFGTTLTT